ncbi:unnamed protein product, partial [Lepidochelys kempii]
RYLLSVQGSVAATRRSCEKRRFELPILVKGEGTGSRPHILHTGSTSSSTESSPMGKCLQGVLPSVPVTSEDGRVCFSPVKWAALVEWQRELCELVTSLEEKQDQPP